MRTALIALGLLTLIAAPAAAGSVGAFASWWDPKDSNDEFAGGILLDFRVGEKVDLEFRASWFDNVVTDLPDDAPGVEIPYSAVPLDFGFAYNFIKDTRKITPYIGGGGTYFLLDADNDEQGRIDDEWGWYGVVGLDLPIGANWKIFIEAMYRDAEATLKGSDLGFGNPAVVDAFFDLRGPAVNGGIAFTW
jgi:hypothetical protein